MDPSIHDDLHQAAASIDAVCDFLHHISPDDLPSPPYAELLQTICTQNTLSKSQSSKREHTGRLAISLAATSYVAQKLPKGWEGAIEYAISIYVHPRVLANIANALLIPVSNPTLPHLAFLRYVSDVIGCYGDKGRRRIEAWLMEMYTLFPNIHLPDTFYSYGPERSYNIDFACLILALRLGDHSTCSITPSSTFDQGDSSCNSDDEFSQSSVTDDDSDSQNTSPACAPLNLTFEASQQIFACGAYLFSHRPLGPLERGHLLSQKRSTLVHEHQAAVALNNYLWSILLYHWPDASLDFCAAMLDLLTSDAFLARMLLRCSHEDLTLVDAEALARAVRAYLGQYWRMRGWQATRDLCLQVWVPLLDIALDMVGLSAGMNTASADVLSSSDRGDETRLAGDDADATLVEVFDPQSDLSPCRKEDIPRRKSLAPYVVRHRGRRVFVSDDGWSFGKENDRPAQLPSSKPYYGGVHTTRRALLEKSLVPS